MTASAEFGLNCSTVISSVSSKLLTTKELKQTWHVGWRTHLSTSSCMSEFSSILCGQTWWKKFRKEKHIKGTRRVRTTKIKIGKKELGQKKLFNQLEANLQPCKLWSPIFRQEQRWCGYSIVNCSHGEWFNHFFAHLLSRLPKIHYAHIWGIRLLLAAISLTGGLLAACWSDATERSFS